MRYIEVKRGYSRQVLFGFEKEIVDKIPLYRRVLLKNGKVARRQNPYLTEYLTDRYMLYTQQIIYDRDKGRYAIDVDKYADAVRKWYQRRGFVDATGTAYPWAAIHRYEDESRQRHPDDDWFNYPDDLKKKGKSHHPISEAGRQREKERRAAYKARKKVIERDGR
jgi:hypothetical protein